MVITTTAKRAFIRLAPSSLRRDRIFLNDAKTQKVFREAFQGLSVLFSACSLGKYQTEINAFRKGAKLKALACFSREVWDSETMLFELMLYHGILSKGWKFATAARKAGTALQKLGLLGAKGQSQTFVRVF